MILRDALYRAITAGRSPRTEGGPAGRMTAELERTYDGHPPPGISTRTWRRLRNEPQRTFAPATLRALRTAQRRARLSRTRETMLRGNPIIGVHAIVHISFDIRERKFILSSWTSGSIRDGERTGLMNRVLDSWLTRDDTHAAELFRAAADEGLTGRAEYRELDFDDVIDIKFWPATETGRNQALMWQRT